ncbi:MAG: hypothetical protein QM731_22565 [Chitinophagaceae bacterium]
MKKQQVIVVGAGVVLLCLIFFFGNTVPPKQNTPAMPGAATPGAETVDIQTILSASKQQLTAQQQAYVTQLETGVVRGDVKEQQIKVFKQLAGFWKDSAHLLLPFGYYSAEAAKLENSQKSLTFAAQFFLDGVRKQENPALRKWMALQAKELFEKALELAPNNDSLTVGLGSCYLFGGISDQPMEGILKIREVAQRDPNNMYAQYMLGMGAMMSGQIDKAIERLSLVAEKEPEKLEVFFIIAEAYEQKGEKANAVKWYQQCRKKVGDNPEIVKEIDQRIKALQQ